MRKRYLVAAGAALVLATGGTFAFAEPGEPRQAVAKASATRTVTLPTGDVVKLTGDGNAIWKPAEGREDKPHLTLTAHDGSDDVITIPSDRLDEIATGKEDPRRYNVSELLRHGQSDAARAKTLSGKRYGRFVPIDAEPKQAANDQKVTVSVTDRDGDAPSHLTHVGFVNPATGKTGELELDGNGKGTVDLGPGRWDFHTSAFSGNEMIQSVTTVNVKDKPVSAVVDGTKAVPVEYQVDRPVKTQYHSISTDTVVKGGSTFGSGAFAGEDTTGYVIPNDADGIKLEVSSQLLGTDTADPYTYDLNFLAEDGIPADPTFTAHDAELAQVERTFDGLITTGQTGACNIGFRKDGSGIGNCTPNEVTWGTTRTEYVTPGPDMTWYAYAFIGDPEADDSIDVTSVATYEPGPAKAITGKAPVSFNVGGQSSVLTRKGDKLDLALPFMDNANRDESIEDFHPVKGELVLTRDGEEIVRKKLTSQDAEFSLPKKDSGKYTLSAEFKRDKKVTPLATKTKVKWTFKSKPTAKETPLNVSAVSFDAEGVKGGYADVKKQQNFTLDYLPQKGAQDTKLKKLTFEVSYDDGKTWKRVKVAIKGDTATGKLKHPADAKFVSVRATATDDAGNKATHSTVHSYGLK